MTAGESVSWMLIGVLLLVVWDQHRTIWKLLGTIDAAVAVMEETQEAVSRIADRLDPP